MKVGNTVRTKIMKDKNNWYRSTQPAKRNQEQLLSVLYLTTKLKSGSSPCPNFMQLITSTNSQRAPTKGSNLLHWFGVVIKTKVYHQLSNNKCALFLTISCTCMRLLGIKCQATATRRFLLPCVANFFF